MGTISKNFSYREFEESATAKAQGITNVISSFEVRDAIRELTNTVLQPLRDAWGLPARRQTSRQSTRSSWPSWHTTSGCPTTR